MKRIQLLVLAFLGCSFVSAEGASAQSAKPNILVIFGDDIGIANVSAYSRGLMGYETPNIDRIAEEGLRFLHYYGEQSCTAGRSAFLTGQHIIRTGLSKVGFPGAPMGMSQDDPSIGGLLRNRGYATGQFGKNHVGDRNEALPTVNGFDEFFGNLYHLNAEEEPELPDYPKDPAFKAKWGPRGVLLTRAADKDDPTADPRFGKIGKQTIKDTGPLTRKRMETIDDETSAAAIDFMKRQQAAGKPFFVWFNSTRMHLRTHVRAEHRGRYKHGDSEYIDGMDIVGKVRNGYTTTGPQGRTYKVHLDGHDQSSFLRSVSGTPGNNSGAKSARNTFFYSDDDGMLVGLRIGDYKLSFAEQRAPGTMLVWAEPFTVMRMTKIYNLMQDPFERADITSNTYWDWIMNHVPQVYQGMEEVPKFVASLKEFPPRSYPPSFNPANMTEETLREIKAGRKLREAFPMLNKPEGPEGDKPR
jgi:arylsulfatase A-like enzyme